MKDRTQKKHKFVDSILYSPGFYYHDRRTFELNKIFDTHRQGYS